MWNTTSGEPYDGPTHELVGNTYSGATRTAASRRLIWTEAPQEKPKVTSSKPKPKKKQPPKPKGSTAWD